MTKIGSIIGHRIDCNGVGALRGQRHIPTKYQPKYPASGMAVLHGFVGSTTLWGAKQLPPQSPRPRPPYFDLLFSAPNQNRHATQASVYCVPFESKRQPGSSFWNPQHRTELIVNLKQPHKSQLFSVRLWSRSVIYKVILENSCCIIYVNVYSYFEKGCRKKCTRQSLKVLWVVLSLLFFKEIWKNVTRGHGCMFARNKGKQQKQVRQLQCQEQCVDHIPYYLSGLSRALFFRQPFSK